MSDVAQWSGEVAITGIGLVTPVGLSAASSLAALRAGVSRIGDLPGFSLPNAAGEMQPATGAQVPVVTANRQGPTRLARMAGYALQEAMTQARLKTDQRCAVFVGTPAPNPGGRLLPYGPTLASGISAALGARATRVEMVETGRAAALQALRLAVRELTAERPTVEVAIAGGVDSLIAPLTLEFLRGQRRLREGPKSTGVLPGEAAGFLVLEKPESAARRGDAILALLQAAAGGNDTTPIGKPNRAVVLGRVLRALTPAVKDPAPLFVSDLNGERQRAYEWMFASSRIAFYHGGMPHWLPSESIGDSGAASGAVAAAWAVGALAKGYARARQAVVWAASDEGPREAIVLQRRNGAL